MKKITMFVENKSFGEVLIEGILFAMGSAVAIAIISSLIIGFQELI